MNFRYIGAGLLVISLVFATGLGGGAIVGYKSAPKEVIKVDSRVTVAKAIRNLRLEPITLPISADVTRTNFEGLNCPYTLDILDWPKSACGKGVWLEGSGFVTARFDLGRVRAKDVRPTADGFVVNISSPEIGWTVLPNELVTHKRPPYWGSRVAGTEAASEFERQARIEMERQLRVGACADNIFDQASAEVKKSLPAFVAISSGNVKVTFETTRGECIA